MNDSAPILELVLAPRVEAPQWEPPPAGRCALLGWVQRRPPVDAGVPAAVAGILGRALCAAGRVTFLSVGRASSAGPDWQDVPSGAARLVVPRPGALRGPPPLPLFCTRDGAVTARLFNDPVFSWDMGGQVAILSPADAPPPDVDSPAVVLAFDVERAQEALHGQAFGVMLPAPDGDFARIVTWDEPRWTDLAARIADESALAGVPLVTLSEAELESKKWYLEDA